MTLDFSKLDGLLPAVIQDHATGRVLMVGFMNEEAFQKTVQSGYATFYSRSRNKLWMKGESSGHRLVVKAIPTDCDADVLRQVEAIGPGVCHEGYESCFFRQLSDGEWRDDRIAHVRTRGRLRRQVMVKLKLGIPKGSLENATVDLFRRAGFNITVTSRSYFPSSTIRKSSACSSARRRWRATWKTACSTRASPAATGSWRTTPNVVTVADLIYAKQSFGKVRWVLAVPEASPVQTVKDLEGKIIATELVEATKKYLRKNGVKAKVEFSWGATEVKPPDLADAIVEVTETGSSLRANKLRIVET